MIYLNFVNNKFYKYIHIKFTRNQLLNLCFFLGHSKRKWFYIYSNMLVGFRNNLLIINMDYSLFLINRTISFLYNIILKYGLIFAISGFVNYKFSGLSQYFFKKYNFGYYDGKYIGGLVSNLFKVRRTKKRYKYEFVSNFRKIKFMPSCFLIFDSNKFYLSFIEANQIRIPSIGFIDSDLNYRYCFYPIIANNESFFIQFYYLLSCIFLKKKIIFLRRFKFFLFYLHIFINILRYKLYLNLIRVIFNKNIEKKKKKKYYNFFRLLLLKYKIKFNFLLKKIETIQVYYGHKYYYSTLNILYILYYSITSRLLFLYKCLRIFKLRFFKIKRRMLKGKFKIKRKKIKRYKFYKFKRLIFKLYYNAIYRLRYFRKLMYDNDLAFKNLKLFELNNKLYHIQYEKYINVLKPKLNLIKRLNNKKMFKLFRRSYYYGFKLYLKLLSLFFAKKFFFYNLQFIYNLPSWRAKRLFTLTFPSRIVNRVFMKKVFQIKNVFYKRFVFLRKFIYKYKNRRFILYYYKKRLKKKMRKKIIFFRKLKKKVNIFSKLGRRKHKISLFYLKLLRRKYFMKIQRKKILSDKQYDTPFKRSRVLKKIFFKRKNWYSFKRIKFLFFRFNYKFKLWNYVCAFLIKGALFIRKKLMRPNLDKILSGLNFVISLLNKAQQNKFDNLNIKFFDKKKGG